MRLTFHRIIELRILHEFCTCWRVCNNKNNPIDQLTFFLGAGKFPTKDQTWTKPLRRQIFKKMYSRCWKAFVQIRMPIFVFRKINWLETVENNMIRYESCLDNLCIYPTESFFHYLVNQYLECLIQLLRLVDQLFQQKFCATLPYYFLRRWLCFLSFP